MDNKIEKMKELISKLNEATAKYDKGTPIMSDKEWDDLYFDLEHLEKETGVTLENSPTQTISYHFQNVEGLSKVSHDYPPMLSLDKTKDYEEIKSFCGDREIIAMLKMDGLTCRLTYEDGKLVRAETRGDGLVGEDVTHNAKVIKSIPKRIGIKDKVLVDGEVICTKEDFEPFSTEYKNARNFAAGSIRLLNAAECYKRNLSFVAWDCHWASNDNLDIKLSTLKSEGFTVVPYYIINNTISEIKEDYLTDVAFRLSYPIDGLVFKYNNYQEYNNAGKTDHHFKGGLAFKFYDEEYETTLLDIEWSMGRTGALSPVAILEPVEIDGTMVSRASLHNVSVMKEILNGFGWKGQRVKVAKMNMIIPQVVWAEEEKEEVSYSKPPAHCPICGGDTCIVISDSGTETLFCNNPACEGKLINVIDHFVSKKGLDIKGLSKATLEKLNDWGWVNSVLDLFLLENKRSEWISKPGFGEKSVDKILSAIKEGSNCSLANFIAAQGIPLIGKTVAKAICEKVDSFDEFYQLILDKFDFSEWEGFGEEKSNALLTFDYSNALEMIDKGHIKIVQPQAEITKLNNSLNGKIICITGKLTHYKNRTAFKEDIEAAGGKVTDSVTTKTNYLVNNDVNSTSAKNKKAKDLGIEILSEEDFIIRFLKNI